MAVTHKEHQDDYNKGFDRGRATSAKFGVKFATEQLNKHFPPGERLKSLSDYYYAKGYMDGMSQ